MTLLPTNICMRALYELRDLLDDDEVIGLYEPPLLTSTEVKMMPFITFLKVREAILRGSVKELEEMYARS